MNKIRLSTPKDKAKKFCTFFLLVFIFMFSVKALDLDFSKFINRLSNVGPVLSKMMGFDSSIILDAFNGMLTSITLAFVSLLIGAVISYVLSFLAASNIAPNKYVAMIIKGIVAIIRAVPALVWVLMVVAGVGFGNTGGMIGLIFPVTGYLTKSFTSTIEELGTDLIEALKATGASWINIVLKCITPTVLPSFISWLAIRMEGNMAESISLGMVGVSGIGQLLTRAISQYNYSVITTIILIIFICMFILELGCNFLKKMIHSVN